MAMPLVMKATEPFTTAGDGPTFDVGCRSIYWGTEASTNPNNPCKGATTRKCAEIDTQITSTGNGSSLVVRTIRDGDGVVKSITRDIVLGDAPSIIQNELLNLPSNAEMTYVGL